MQFQSSSIPAEEAGQRLDHYLAKHSAHSRSQLKGYIKQGRVLVNRAPAKANYLLKEGDQLRLNLPKQKKPSSLKAQDIPLKILHEDDELLVINKAPGIVVHPDKSGHAQGTIVNAVLAHCPGLSGVGQEARPGIVHRLDKDTSGVLLIAKTDAMHQKLSQLFAERKVTKEYLALVKGHPKTQKGSIRAAIKRGQKQRQQMAIHHEGKMAVTHFEVLESFEDCSLLKVNIETGRTHQIRLHLASIRLPVVGDSKYGNTKFNRYFKEKTGLNRQFLHAHKLHLENRHFEAPLWKDLEEVLSHVRA